MTKRKVLMIGLDGYEASLGDAMMAKGQLPALKRLRERSACFLLDQGRIAKRTGLIWEQFSSGLAPDRWSAIDFDTESYTVRQPDTLLTPFVTSLSSHTVVFDVPYFNLDCAQRTQGLVNWGAHDAGVKPSSRPANLQQEIISRFGAYPAKQWLYGFVWPSAEKAQTMADDLIHATEVRSKAARWLLTERLPDWDLGIVVVSELHSAIESLWHGIDPQHPLHGLPSANPAGEGVRAIYCAVDKLVGELTEALPDASIVLFSLNGMGANNSDVASMVLLPELLYRHAFYKSYIRTINWPADKNGIPILSDEQVWEKEMRMAIVGQPPVSGNHLLQKARRIAGRLAHRLLPKRLTRLLPKTFTGVDWMPAERYQPYWPDMRAFAVPSYTDGCVRINLAGREAKGKVPLHKYNALCDEIEALLHACRNPLTGEPVVKSIDRCAGADPLQLGPSESDLVIDWNSAPLGFVHPEMGHIGPIPHRRTGGHTGKYGMAFVTDSGMAPGDYGVRSSFDVVPTAIEMLGERQPAGLSGESLCSTRGPVPLKEKVSARV